MSKGFTLIEILIYVAIFAVVSGFFVGILLITLRVQGTQSGLVEISSQLNFAMQTIQRHVREANSISAPASGTSGSTLTVNKPAGVVTITRGTCGAPAVVNAICVTEAGAAALPITTSKIGVTTLNFTHFTNPSSLPCPGTPCVPATETIQIEITANNLSINPEQSVTRTLRSAASPFKQ